MVAPILLDLYADDLRGKPDLTALAEAGRPWCGVWLKATEGTYYPKDTRWFQAFWPAVKDAGEIRYGVDWFRGAYHYFRVDEDPIKQADFYLGLIELAGGWDSGDLWPIVDVETAEQPANVSTAQIIDSVTKFAQAIEAKHGRAPALYAGSYLRDRSITDHMGCRGLIVAAYGSNLPSHLYTSIGWPLEKLIGWQYQGTESYSGPASYPRQCPAGQGPLDLTAVTICNGATADQQLAWLREDIKH